jgi:hypothetical protein
MTTVHELLDDIFGANRPAFYPEFEEWVRGSRRYRAFAVSYRAKIRAKLRNAGDDDALTSLRAELETAALLLREERFTLEYEKYAASKQRGPDFTVTFKTHTPFNVEVRRLRSVELADADAEARAGRLMGVLADKVGQMPAGIVNVLWLVAEEELPEADLAAAAMALRQLAERKVEAYFTRRGFKGAAHFLKQYRQLSAIYLRRPGEPVLWLNAIARHSLPSDIATALRRLTPPPEAAGDSGAPLS